MKRRHFQCACCGRGFESDKPQDPQRDTGYGLCVNCKPVYAKDAVKCGFAGKEYASFEDAMSRFSQYA